MCRGWRKGMPLAPPTWAGGVGRNTAYATRSTCSIAVTRSGDPRGGLAPRPPGGLAGLDGPPRPAHRRRPPSPSTARDRRSPGSTPRPSNRMPEGRHSSIAWLIWHAARQQDVQIAETAGTDDVWRAAGWADPPARDRPPIRWGSGDGPAEIAAVRVDDAGNPRGLSRSRRGRACDYIDGLSVGRPRRHRGPPLGSARDPPPGATGQHDRRWVAHVAQAQYLRGLWPTGRSATER